MANTIAGGVQLINTLTQKNNGEFPIVMAESVSLNDGTTVEDKFKTIVNYSHPNTPGYKHVPAGGSDGQILRWKADGEAQWGDDNTGEKYEVFKPATSTTSAVDGLVPAPSINETNRFLKSDGTWGIPTDTTYEEVTETLNENIKSNYNLPDSFTANITVKKYNEEDTSKQDIIKIVTIKIDYNFMNETKSYELKKLKIKE